MTKASTAYELLTKAVFEELSKLEGWKTLEITHDKKVTSSTGVVHQIDVYIRYELLGREQEVVIECKDYQTPVDKTRLMAFVGVVKDLMRVQGMFVTRKGFDKGNIAPLAEAHNIGLYILDDTDNLAIKFSANLYEHLAQVVGFGFEKDFDPKAFNDLRDVICEDWLIYDKDGVFQTNLQLLMDEALNQMLTRNITVGERITKLFEREKEFYIQDRSCKIGKTRILSFAFEKQIRIHKAQVDFKLTHLLQIVTNDKRYYVSQDHKIYRVGDDMPIPVVFESVGPRGEDMIVNVITRIKQR